MSYIYGQLHSTFAKLKPNNMKRILLSLFLLVFVASANSQTLRLLVNGVDLTNSSYTFTTPVTNTDDIKIHIDIANISNSDAAVLVSKNVISSTEGHMNSFCIGDCYPPSANVSTTPYTIAANDTSDAFYVEYIHGNIIGKSVIEYTISDRNDANNVAHLTLTFDVITSSIESKKQNILLTAYPNPVTNGEISFKIDGVNNLNNSYIIIRDILGATVKVIDLNSNIVRTNVTDLANGIYIYTFEQNGIIIATKRFLIRK